jgi:dTDP-glucose 4,6-dehydratase
VRDPKCVMVTGGCGFIGSAFIHYLFGPAQFGGKVVNLDALTYAANPANVAGVVDPHRYVFVHGNVCDEALVHETCQAHSVDCIVHFAAESHVDRSILGPEIFIETNVVGTTRLLQVVRNLQHIHFHHVSTDEVYGSLGPTELFTEKTPYAPNSPYAASKAASDLLVRGYAHTFGLSTTVSNCSNNYGPRQFPEKLIPLMVLNMMESKPLPVYGDGSNVRDWLYVDDHAEAIWLVVKNGRNGETYNVGGAAEFRNLDLLHALIQAVAEVTRRDAGELKSLITFVKDRPGHDQRYAIDFSKIRSELGWSPRHQLDRGLRETVRWYVENPEWVEQVRSGAYRNWLEQNYEGR